MGSEATSMSEPAVDLPADRRPPARPLALRPVPQPDAIPAKRCPVGHPNDPEAVDCRLCDRRLDPAAGVVDLVPRTLARLLLEDGTAVEVVESLAVGRCPEPEGTGGDGDRHRDGGESLTVSGRRVSRIHFGIEVRGWRLLIRDRGSTNGTFLVRRSERGRRRVPEDRPVPLRIGDTIHFGGRQALVADPGR